MRRARRAFATSLAVFALTVLSADAAWTGRAAPAQCRAAAMHPYDRIAGGAAEVEHGGGLNACGCHFNRRTGECHCHRPRGCGCECQPASC